MITDDFEALRAGEWINGFTDEIAAALGCCEELCYEFNAIPPSQKERRNKLLGKIFDRVRPDGNRTSAPLITE